MNTIALVELQYKDTVYKIPYELKGGVEESDVIYLWEEGNYSCDYNRSLFIQRGWHEDFPLLECECGKLVPNKITLNSITFSANRKIGFGKNPTTVTVDDWNEYATLEQWGLLIEKLTNLYGSQAILSADAGYNDVSLVLTYEQVEASVNGEEVTTHPDITWKTF